MKGSFIFWFVQVAELLHKRELSRREALEKIP